MESATLDLRVLRSAIEQRDAALVTSLYADDAELVSVRRDAPPRQQTGPNELIKRHVQVRFR